MIDLVTPLRERRSQRTGWRWRLRRRRRHWQEVAEGVSKGSVAAGPCRRLHLPLLMINLVTPLRERRSKRTGWRWSLLPVGLATGAPAKYGGRLGGVLLCH